jgi:transposase
VLLSRALSCSLDPRRLTLQARRSDPVLAVFKRTTLGLTAREVTEHLHVSASSQKLWLSTFEKTGDVFQKRGAQGRPRALSKDERFDLVMRVLDSPTTTLDRQHALIYLASGERVSLPTLCRVLHVHNLCHQRIQHLALRRDED